MLIRSQVAITLGRIFPADQYAAVANWTPVTDEELPHHVAKRLVAKLELAGLSKERPQRCRYYIPSGV